MLISDLDEKQIVVGLRIQSLNDSGPGTVVIIDHLDDNTSWVVWDRDLNASPNPTYGSIHGNGPISSAFYWNHCRCLVLEDQTLPVKVQEFLTNNNYSKCKCKDCSKSKMKYFLI